MAAIDSIMELPVLDAGTTCRPDYARGPRSIADLRLLRISVTDRCNLRCVYCMPDGGVDFEARENVLAPDQIDAVARVARDLGVTHVKLTGGEPTIRKELLEIVSRLDRIGFDDLSLTTNGLLLPRLAADLRVAGLDRLTLSIDSLRPERYRSITGGGRLDQFWRGVEAATAAGFRRLKLNVVVIRGFNDDEVADFAELAVDHDWTIRFIEYMPLGDSQVLALAGDDGLEVGLLENEEVKRRIETRLGPIRPIERAREVGVGPAEVFGAPSLSGRLGFISAMSQPFCEHCNRLRLTATGELRACLFDGGELDLAPLLRIPVDVERLKAAFTSCFDMKPATHGNRGTRQMSQLGG